MNYYQPPLFNNKIEESPDSGPAATKIPILPLDIWPGSSISQGRDHEAKIALYNGIESILNQTGDQDSERERLEKAGEILEAYYTYYYNGALYDKHVGLFQAAIAYYLAGHYARAYVIIKNLEELPSSSDPLNLLKRFFLKDILASRSTVRDALLSPEASDEAVSNSLLMGELYNTEAINYVFKTTLARSISLIQEHIESGRVATLDAAEHLLNLGRQLSVKWEWFAWWTLMQSTRALLKEYKANSLWTVLAPLLDDDASGASLKYCQAASQRQPPISELWRTQVQTFPHINEPERSSYCIKMPTSSGKTQIAELAILRFIADTATDPAKKCIYIAPFRALATELEQSFKTGLGVAGIGVTELYGGFDLTPVDFELFENSRVVIATPEKADAFLRFRPELAKQIGLLIIDEGHIIEMGSRGLKYEFFLHRMVRRFTDNGIRTFFISAVMPNPEQFTTWITREGPTERLIKSSWRPTRLALGILEWRDYSAHIEYMYKFDESGKIERLPRLLIPEFIRRLPTNDLRKISLDKKGKIALAAIEAVENHGPTLVFAPQPRQVRAIAESIIKAIEVKSTLGHGNRGQPYRLQSPQDSDSVRQWEECINYASEIVGPNDLITRALRSGFILHHGEIPSALRARLEALVRAGVVQLTVATNTLSQGVNLPAKIILIHSFLQGENKYVSAMDFFNLCGRAGRAMKENDGIVLLCTDAKGAAKAKQQLKKYIKQDNEIRVESAIKALLERIVKEWDGFHSTTDFGQLCFQLAENQISWMPQEQQELLNQLDKGLLSLVEELGVEDITPENIQKIFERSLLFLQLNATTPASKLTEQEAVDLLSSRIKYIHKKLPDSVQRRRFYRIGLALADYTFLVDNRDSIVEALAESNNYLSWDLDTRIEYLVNFCNNYLWQLSDISADKLNSSWPRILDLWLHGKTVEEIQDDSKVNAKTDEIGAVINGLFDYRLPWGFSALFSFLDNDEAEIIFDPYAQPFDTLAPIVPEIARYFPSMIRYGVHSPVAAILMSLGLSSRITASTIAEYYDGTFSSKAIRKWLSNLTEAALDSWNIDPVVRGELFRFTERLLSIISTNDTSLGELIISAADKQYLAPIDTGSRLISQWNQGELEFYTSAGELVGKISSDDNVLQGLIGEQSELFAEIQESPSVLDDGHIGIKITLRRR